MKHYFRVTFILLFACSLQMCKVPKNLPDSDKANKNEVSQEKIVETTPKDEDIPMMEDIPRVDSNKPAPPPPPPPPPPPLPDEVFKVVEDMPHYPGCEEISSNFDRKKCSDDKITAYVKKNMKYPELAKENDIEGIAVIRFIVGMDGTRGDYKILRDPGAGTGDEALRIVQSMPKWIPGKQRGRLVNVQYTLPVRFEIEGKVRNEDLPRTVDSMDPPPAAKPNRPRPPAPPPPPPPPPPPSSDEIFMIVEYMPHFPGCESIENKDERKKCSDEKLIAFINENMKYPKVARENGIEGTAVIRFVVEKDGSITFNSNKRRAILRDPGGGCGDEALRVVKSMPNWIPGKQRGNPVSVQYTLPFKFSLPEPEEEEAPVPQD